MNKDLILRERLAIERTDMAIDRTLLSFIRTSLYFATAGWTITNLVKVDHGPLVATILWAAAVVLAVLGIYKYLRQKAHLRQSRKQIGGAVADWTEEV